VTSALLFAAIHLNLQGFVVYAWLGLVFARVYVVTGRLGAAVAVHFGNNAITLAAPARPARLTSPRRRSAREFPLRCHPGALQNHVL
jgi:membrane protease YdiL (CAAX protease family)